MSYESYCPRRRASKLFRPLEEPRGSRRGQRVMCRCLRDGGGVFLALRCVVGQWRGVLRRERILACTRHPVYGRVCLCLCRVYVCVCEFAVFYVFYESHGGRKVEPDVGLSNTT